MKTAAELREIAHRARHYDQSHSTLSVVKLAPYTCDSFKETIGVSYRDIAEWCDYIATLQEAVEELHQKVAEPPTSC